MSAALEHLLTWADHHPTDDELADLMVAFHLDGFYGSITSDDERTTL